MANQWFRMYSEFATDPKVQMMDEVSQRRFVMLLCLRCSNGDKALHETFHDEEIAFQLRIDLIDWLSTKELFLSKGLIDNFIEIVSWDKRQFHSDTSTERVRKHRAKSINVIETQCNVSVTPPDTDTDTDTDTEVNPFADDKDLPAKIAVIDKDLKAESKKAVLARFVAFWSEYPRKDAKVQAEKAFLKIAPDDRLFSKIMNSLSAAKRSDQWSKDGGKFIQYASTWLNQSRWEDEIPVKAACSSIGGLPANLFLVDEVAA